MIEALEGFTVGVSVLVLPTLIVSELLSSETLVTGLITVITQVALNSPLAVAAVIVVLPVFSPFTTPFEVTVATF